MRAWYWKRNSISWLADQSSCFRGISSPWELLYSIYCGRVGPKLPGSFTHNKLELALTQSFKWVNSFHQLAVEGCASEKCSPSHWVWVYGFFPPKGEGPAFLSGENLQVMYWRHQVTESQASPQKNPLNSVNRIGPASPRVFELPGCTRISSLGCVFSSWTLAERISQGRNLSGSGLPVSWWIHTQTSLNEFFKEDSRAVISNALLEPRYCTFKYSSTKSY